MKGRRPRRLLWIHQNFVTARQPGNSRPVHIISALLERGWQVDVITGQAGYLDSPSCVASEDAIVERDGSLALHRLPVRSQGVSTAARRRAYVEFSWHARRYAWSFEGIDLVYCSSPPLPQVLLSTVLAARWRVPMVFEVRDLWPAFIAEAGALRSRAAIVAMEWLEALACRYAAHVIPVSPSYVRHLAAMGVSEPDMTVLPTGADPRLARFDPQAGRRWRRENGLDGKFIILYAGSQHEYYGLDVALKAAQRMHTRPDIVWVFAGDGRGRNAIESAAGRLGNVVHSGSLAKDELVPAYSAADAALVTMGEHELLHAMLPAKTFDAMAAGLPVVSTARGPVGAMVEASGCGVVVGVQNAAALAVAVERMADAGEAERRRLGENGRRWALCHTNARVMARGVAAIVDEVFERKYAAARARFSAACAGALKDTLTRRSRRSIDRWYRDCFDETIRADFSRWMAGSISGDDSEYRISPLLSVPRTEKTQR